MYLPDEWKHGGESCLQRANQSSWLQIVCKPFPGRGKHELHVHQWDSLMYCCPTLQCSLQLKRAGLDTNGEHTSLSPSHSLSPSLLTLPLSLTLTLPLSLTLTPHTGSDLFLQASYTPSANNSATVNFHSNREDVSFKCTQLHKGSTTTTPCEFSTTSQFESGGNWLQQWLYKLALAYWHATIERKSFLEW